VNARNEKVDTVVIGAGFAGLAAARALADDGIGVVVLEARDRVGGRAHTVHLDDGTSVDVGGQWIGPTQDAMYALAAEHGVETYPLPAHGAPVYRVGDALLHELPAGAIRLLDEFDALAATVDTHAPWDHPQATALDALTLQAWLDTRDTGTPDEKALVGRLLAGGLKTVSAGEASVLDLAFYVASGHGVGTLLDAEGGAQQDRIVGGPHAVAEAIARSLPAGSVRLNEPVHAVELVDDVVVVHTSDGMLRADHVIVAIPAATVPSAIRFTPDLPLPKRLALGRLHGGIGIKTNLVYDRPFWRDAGLSGQSNHSAGVVTETADGTTPDAVGGVLTAFVYGDEAIALRRLSPDAAVDAIVESLADVFGPQVREHRDAVTLDWADERWTGGCFSAGFGAGGLSRVGEDLRPAAGRIHFAGTEYAHTWNGYFEGAVGSGREAAAAVAADRRAAAA